MLIEPLIRMGRPLLQYGDSFAEHIANLTDGLRSAARFYQAVVVVEVEGNGATVGSYATWGGHSESGRRTTFSPDDRMVAAPVILSGGGSRRNAQGRYGVPVYPFWKEDLGSPEAVSAFLKRRQVRTWEGDQVTDDVLAQIAPQLAERVAAIPCDRGLVVLCINQPDAVYYRADHAAPLPANHRRLTASHMHSDQDWRVDLEKILERIWWAKMEEASKVGHSKEGRCSFCGCSGEVVSIYSRAWLWFTVTWTGPLPSELADSELHQAVALCQTCYAAMSLGEKTFADLSQPLARDVVHAVFNADRPPKSRAAVPQILASIIVVPLLAHRDTDQYGRDFARAVAKMRRHGGDVRPSGAERHLDHLLGFTAVLPVEFDVDDYRLSVTYYTQANADVHLWAFIDGIVPSHLDRLDDLFRDLGSLAHRLDLPSLSLPQLLAYAFGPGYLWPVLTRVLEAGPIDSRLAVGRYGRRLTHLAKAVPRSNDAYAEFYRTVRHYLVFQAFWRQYATLRSMPASEEETMMKTWHELTAMLDEEPERWSFSTVEDLAYVTGSLVRRFSAQYYAATKKDYLETRVMTFGAALGPELLGRQALGKIQELAGRLRIRLDNGFRRQIGVALAEYVRVEPAIRSERDRFLAAFWAGYGMWRSRHDEIEADESDVTATE